MFEWAPIPSHRSRDIKPEHQLKMFLLNAVYVAHAEPDSVTMAWYAASKAFIDAWGEELTDEQIVAYV